MHLITDSNSRHSRSGRLFRKSAAVFLAGAFIFFRQPVQALQAMEMNQNETAETDRDRTAGELYALSAVLMDADNGRILLEKNGDQVLPMASTTKIMTCILALEEGNPGDYACVSAYAAGMPKVRLGMYQGQLFRLEDLLYSLMLESHNDSAVVIAEHIGCILSGQDPRTGEHTEEESRLAVGRFVQRMNEKAEEIGCKNTYFVTPNGLDAIALMTDENGVQTERQHASTAADMAAVLRYCIALSPAKEQFLEITGTRSCSFSDYTGKGGGQPEPGRGFYTVNNHNAFLDMMEGALTGKTGFTGKAGYCYVGALARDGKTFCIALLACGWPGNRSWKWHDAAILYEYGLNHYEKTDLFEQPSLPLMPVENGTEAFTALTVQREEISLLLSGEDQTYTRLALPESLQAPVRAGSRAGWQEYFVNDSLYARLPVCTVGDVQCYTFRYCLDKLIRLMLL